MKLHILGLVFRSSVAALLTTSLFTARAAAVERDFYAGGEITLQLFRDGTPVSNAAVGGIGNFIGIDDDGSRITFSPAVEVPPAQRPLLFQEFTPSPDGPAAYVLNYFNSSNLSDPLNNTVVDLRGLQATLTGTVPTNGSDFNTAGLTFSFIAGTFNLAGPTAVDLTGDNGAIANVSDGSSFLGTYIYPINVDVPISTPFGNIDAVFSGNITSVSLPEPGTITLVVLGLLALVPVLRRRRQSLQ